MNLEGTKHEKAVLVIIAYIIGFTSGFIAFGITDHYKKPAFVAPDQPPVVTEVPAMPEDMRLPTGNPPAIEDGTESLVSYEDGKLYATVGADRFVLSLHSEIIPTENVEGFSTQGIHESLPAYSASADGRYIHFCEQQTAAPVCTHFIFDTANTLIHPVSADGEKVVTENEVAKTARFEGDIISVGTYQSLTPETPWKVTARE